ncbi:disulfide bond formation protein B [Pararobbsia silviterrae]|uniref:Disulfide bond formation protein B n=1 Tax=Pararobbsia silviterrae TaxID=1792498 RepID=A0A494Y9B7_9BURK|nr:disulfide bond formation protein B [Pararobbsia silviterrae]RKP59234.1 disulfide bond formation protein B [Pararobbsia silviterrae]
MIRTFDASSRLLARERRRLLALAIVCIGLVCGALYLQIFQREDPCPLCILQRYGYLLIAIFALIGSTSSSWRSIAISETLVLLSALGGLATAARHVWVQAHPSFSCGFDKLQPIVDGLPPAKWLPQVFQVAGLCETPYPPLLGLTLPQWSLVGFVLVTVLVARSMWTRKRVLAAGR